MGCSTCAVSANGVPTGCGDKGNCSTGSCNKKNTYDWLTTMDIPDPYAYDIVEISFKKGNRKGFYFNPSHSGASTGDMVVVQSAAGYDVGRIGLSGDLVRLQMKKKKTKEENVIHKIIRVANFRDLEKLAEARALEKKTMVRARAIARTLDLDMKVGDVEYQGDKRKATFYYTADGRVDFRELVRMFAKEFRVKIEMKQIGSRQESSLIGGIGTCGRELCCSTWRSNFETVTTTAARYQNLAINQTKLTGQCGRLKCCLNYELDTYIDALGDFPKKADTIKLEGGYANLVKTDIFKGIMFYSVHKDNIRGPLIAISKEKVKKLLDLNKSGKLIKDITAMAFEPAAKEEINEDNIEHDFADVTGTIVLPEEKKKKGKNRNRNRKDSNRRDSNKKRPNTPKNQSQSTEKKEGALANKKAPPQNKDGKKRRPNRKPKRSKPNPNNKTNRSPKGPEGSSDKKPN